MSEATLPSPPPQVDTGKRLPRGRAGMICLILTESAFFAIFVVGYLFYIGKSLSGPYPKDVLEFPVIATIALLSSSATIVVAVRELRRGNVARFAAGFFLTIALGVAFVAMTASEWVRLIYTEGLTISTNLFGTTFYSLVGFHAAHVCVGVLIMSGILLLTVLGHVQEDHAENVELVSWYWHFVDVVWIVVFTSVYLIGV